jgi:hypothetical protein
MILSRYRRTNARLLRTAVGVAALRDKSGGAVGNRVHRARSLITAALICLASTAAPAAPMGFKDSTMVMADLSSTWREVWVNRAFTARDAIGAGGLYMRSDDGRLDRTLAEVTYTRLAQR